MTDFEKLPAHFPAVAKSARIVRREGNHYSIDATTRSFGRLWSVRMEADVVPGVGFTSTNASKLGVERESFMMSDASEGTRIDYLNDVEVRMPLFRVLATPLLKWFAVWYWKRKVIDKLEDTASANR